MSWEVADSLGQGLYVPDGVKSPIGEEEPSDMIGQALFHKKITLNIYSYFFKDKGKEATSVMERTQIPENN